MINIEEIRERWADYKEPWRFEVRPQNHSMYLVCRRNIVFDIVRWGMDRAQLRFNVNGLMVKASQMLELFPGEEHHPWRKWIKHPVAQCIENAPEDISALLTEVERLTAEKQADVHCMDTLTERLDDALQEMKRLQNWVNDLLKGKTVNCVYCGYQYGPDENTPVAFADVLKEHIARCPKHPMSALTAENARLRAELDALQRSEADGAAANEALHAEAERLRAELDAARPGGKIPAECLEDGE